MKTSRVLYLIFPPRIQSLTQMNEFTNFNAHTLSGKKKIFKSLLVYQLEQKNFLFCFLEYHPKFLFQPPS